MPSRPHRLRRSLSAAACLLLAVPLGASGPDDRPPATMPRPERAPRALRVPDAPRAPERLRAQDLAHRAVRAARTPHPGGVWFLGKSRHLGVQLIDITPDLRRHFGAAAEAGVLVGEVVAGSSAAAAGVQVGDLLTAIEGEPITDAGDVRHLLMSREKGDTVRLEVIRDRRALSFDAKVEQRADDELAITPGARLLPKGALPELHWTFDARAPRAFDCGDADSCENLGDDIRKYFEGGAWEKALEQVQDHRETLIDRVEGLEAKLRHLEQQLGQLERGERR